MQAGVALVFGHRLAKEIGLGRGPGELGGVRVEERGGRTVDVPVGLVQRDHVAVGLAPKTGPADVVVVDHGDPWRAGLEEVQEVHLEGSQVGLVVPFPFVEHLVNDVGLIAGGLDDAFAESLEEELVLLLAGPRGVVSRGHFRVVFGQFDELRGSGQRAAVGLVEGVAAKARLGPAVVDGQQNDDVLAVGQLHQRAQAVEVRRVELVEVKLGPALVPGPDLRGVVPDSAVGDLVSDADVGPNHQNVNAPGGQGVDVCGLVEVGAQFHPALGHRVPDEQGLLASELEPVGVGGDLEWVRPGRSTG